MPIIFAICLVYFIIKSNKRAYTVWGVLWRTAAWGFFWGIAISIAVNVLYDYLYA